MTVAITQTVTVLFTDLVGSTELSSRLGPGAADALRQAHFGLLRGAIQVAGGTEVKNLGDGLMVAFTSLSRALACAVAMQQAIERHNRRGEGSPLSVRIGISAGEAIEDDGDYFGDPVIEASRLCAKAEGGQILAAEVVRAMAGRHATQEFASVGDLELKGLPEPVATVEVMWEPALAGNEAASQFPLPARLVTASAESLFAFFGRAHELTHLSDTQKASAAENRLRVVLISGEPGMGKTTLVAQAARAAHGVGANVVYGNCEEGLGVPYHPWIAALGQLVAQSDETVLRDFVESKGLLLARLLPDLARRVSSDPPAAGSDADAERFLILEGVARLLALASTRAPLVVVLDDLHWVDAASLQLLRHLVTSAIPMSVMVVGTFRESDLSRSHPLTAGLADLRRERSVDRLDLLGLEDIEIIELLGAAAGHEVPDEGVALAHALRRETGGNPFFVVELLLHLSASGAFVQDDKGRWGLSIDPQDLDLPTSVREVVTHRVARLGEETQQALSLASVMGQEFDSDVLSRLIEKDQEELLDILEGSIAAGLISEAEDRLGHYRFVHSLIQHALYQGLSANRRQLAHKRVAEVLESEGTVGDQQVAELARHWMAATRPSDVRKALHYTRRAGDVALAAYAPLDAASWYSHALELLEAQVQGDDRERCALLIGLGTAQQQGGQTGYSAPLREAGRIARRIEDRDLLVRVALSREPGAESLSEVDPERLAVLEAALEAVGPVDSEERARLLACLADEIDQREVAHGRDIAAEAFDVAHRLGDEATLLDVVNLAMSRFSTPDTLDQRLEETKLALILSERVGDVSARFQALNLRTVSCGEMGDLYEVDSCLAEMKEIATQTELPRHRWQVCATKSWRHLLVGAPAEAEAAANEAFEIGLKIGLPYAISVYGGHLLRIYMEQGRLGEMVDIALQAGEENPTLPGWRQALMLIYCELGRSDEAGALLDTDQGSDFRDFPFDVTWLQSMAFCADCTCDLGRLSAAAVLYERFLPYIGRYIFLGTLDQGAVTRPVGRLATLLGRYEDAESHLRLALEMHERMRAAYWIARTQVDLSELMLTRQGVGDAQAARSWIQEARLSAHLHGYRGLFPRVDQLLSRLD
jgi:class 3 adenylate cyclase/tetratricopeptide (TPR) repeat protein